MKIDRIQNQHINNLYKANEKNKPIESEKLTKSSVSIEISDSAKELIQKVNGSNEAGFSERVEKIRQSIIDDNYKISSEDIADKIIKTLEAQKGSGN